MEKINMDMSYLNTLKTLEKRQSWINKKLQSKIKCNDNTISHLVDEIIALEKVIYLIKWIVNNSSEVMIQKLIEDYKQDKTKETDKKIEEEDEMDDFNEEEETIYGIFKEKLSNKYKIEIVLSRNRDINFIGLELKKTK